jgi:hypothetical protein
MAEENGNADSASSTRLRRYVPLAVWAVAILTVLAIPLKIIGYGYLPPDDTLGDAAKAVSGKPWPEILVIGPAFMMDHHFGWHWLLREIFLWSNCSTETLVLLIVVTMFVVSGWSALACLKRPEVWLVALMVFCLSSNVPQRLMLGRPFALTITVLVSDTSGMATPRFVAAEMVDCRVDDVADRAAFFCTASGICGRCRSRRFFSRDNSAGASCWRKLRFAGTIMASALTGHPVEYILQAVTLALRVEAIHTTQSTLVGEMQPAAGNFFGLLLLGCIARRAPACKIKCAAA